MERRKSAVLLDNVKKRRSDELYIRWKEMRRNLDKVAEESSKELEKNWREQGSKLFYFCSVIKCSFFIMLCLRSIPMDRVISESI